MSLEENRPRWGARTSNPCGTASLSRVGSTPTLLRQKYVNKGARVHIKVRAIPFSDYPYELGEAIFQGDHPGEPMSNGAMLRVRDRMIEDGAGREGRHDGSWL